METADMFLKVFFSILSIGICYLITMAAAYLKQKLKNARNWSQAKDGLALQNLFDFAEDVLLNTTAVTVAKLEQIVGKDLREAVKNGQAGKNELFALAGDAYAEIIETIQPEIFEYLQLAVGDTELYIKNGIEAELIRLKEQLYS